MKRPIALPPRSGTRRGRRVPRAGRLVAAALALLCGGAPLVAQTLGQQRIDPNRPFSRVRTLTLNIKDGTGVPIPEAVAVVEGLSTEPADAQGSIRIDVRPPLRLPLLVNVEAPGFRPRQIMLDGISSRGTDIFLERATADAPRDGRTVSVAELSGAATDSIQKLEEEALRALQARDAPRAERLFRAAIARNASICALWVNLGIALLQQRKIDEATAAFEKAYHLAPYDRAAAGNLGLMRCADGRLDECHDLLDRALSLGFASPMAHYAFGVLALQRGHHRAAAEALAAVDPRRFRHRDLFLSLAQRGSGQSRAARRSFLEYLRRNPIDAIRAALAGPRSVAVSPPVEAPTSAARASGGT